MISHLVNIAEYLMDFLRYLPTYLPDLSEDLARSRKVFLIRLEQELADLEGPPQAVLTKEQNKSLEK
jgi:hypothetical protein